MPKAHFSKSRRQFFKQSATLTATSVMATQAMGLEQFIGSSPSDDYKALVFIFLNGGNDSFNMLAPKADGILRERYEAGRRDVALPASELHALNPQSAVKISDGQAYNGFGVHNSCRDIAQLFNQQELSFICNVGNIVEPTTRAAFMDKTANLPPHLFSHSDQQRQYQSGPTTFFDSGWGGRMAEALESFNTNTPLSSLISLSGLNSFQVTQQGLINPYVMGKSGLLNLKGMRGERTNMLDTAMSAPPSHLIANKYYDVYQNMQTAQDTLGGVFDTAMPFNDKLDEIFQQATQFDENTISQLGQRLKTVAKLIAGRSATTNKRPIYFVTMGGFDTHQQILADHQGLMHELNGALKAFRDSLVELGDFDKTMTFVGSEFGRTFTPNGTGPNTGTDHAWGGHSIVMGGMVNGGHLFGEHPDLQLNQGLDASKGRGRWIPTTAVSQCSAVMANWMGVAPSDIPALFPTMANFPSPYETESNLSFIKSGAVS